MFIILVFVGGVCGLLVRVRVRVRVYDFYKKNYSFSYSFWWVKDFVKRNY